MSPVLAPSADTDRLDAALALAERGFAVFPLRPDSKVPAVRGDWEGAALADPDRLRALGWPPGGNIGIACGPSGLFVLDLDVPKSPEPDSELVAAGPAAADTAVLDGAAVLRDLADGRPIPPTLTVATPSGGTHLYFRPPGTLKLRNTVARLGPLIDTRAAGGYVVAPGSTIRGRAYAIVEDAPIAPIPRWIVRELIVRGRAALPPLPPGRPAVAGPRLIGPAAAAYGAAALRNETERMLAARVGTRNDTLNRAAYALGRLVGAGLLDRDLAASELFHAARRSGLPARECASTLSSGLSAGIARPRYPNGRRPVPVALRAVGSSPRTPEPAPAPAAEPTPVQRRDEDVRSALRAVDRAYDEVARCAAPLVFSRDWRRVRALADALRDLRDTPRPGAAEARRATALCQAIADLADAAARDFPAPGRKRARSPLGNALRDLAHRARAAVRALSPA
jgi:hypothetical protein